MFQINLTKISIVLSIVTNKIAQIYSPIDYINVRRFIFQTFTVYTEYHNWQLSSAECKSNHDSYLFEDVNLTDLRQACNLIQGQPQGPSWLGIAKDLELYISTYGGRFQT